MSHMASLSDQIDRLSRNTRAIRATAAHTAAAVARPFTRAVLNLPLGDLIRDIDPSELGLFSLKSPTPQVARAEFTGATPLRKHPPRRDAKDVEPEVYAHAALKCIDRYHAIRPMPRAHSQVTEILERLALVHKSIQSLTETLHQAQSSQGPPSKVLAENEERRVQELQARIVVLQERKKNASSSKAASSRKKTTHTALQANPKSHPPSSPQEDNFWNTPAATARTLRFSDNLLDEHVDLGNISTASFTSSLPRMRKSGATPQLNVSDDSLAVSPLAPLNRRGDFDFNDQIDQEVELQDTLSWREERVILSKPTPAPDIQVPLVKETQEYNPPAPLDTFNTRQPKIRINGEVERITAKIWTTMGDIIMPGHAFDTSGHGVGNKTPRAKETISAHLQSLSALSPPPASPTVSSVSSLSTGLPTPPTSQQILTAHLLLSLLASPPHFSLPLNKAKDKLAEKANSGSGVGAVAQGTTRILYGCVAKRLVKIDRGGGEQIVKFDI